MSHRFNSGKPGYFTCDRLECDSPLMHGSLMHVVGPLIREHLPESGDEVIRRDYCSAECVTAEYGAGRVEPWPHDPSCITVKRYHARGRFMWDQIICSDVCPLKDSPQRWREVACG